MPLKSNIDNAAFQVYFCTRAKRDASVTSEVRPETCILRSLAMFFYVRNVHVEDLKNMCASNRSSSKNTQVYIYHITEHNLRSQIFKKQLLVHLERNSLLVFLRGAEFEFPDVYAFFPSGCTIELRRKLKHLHDKAVIVTERCYENAAIELIREIKKIQEKLLGNKLSSGHTFPIVLDNTVTSLTFGMPISGVHVESVTKVSGLRKIAIKLRRQDLEKGGEKSETRRPDVSQLSGYASSHNSPLAVTSIELRLRRTVFEPRNDRNEIPCKETVSKRSCDLRRNRGDDSRRFQHCYSGSNAASTRKADQLPRKAHKSFVSSSTELHGRNPERERPQNTHLHDGRLPNRSEDIVNSDIKLAQGESADTDVACTPEEPCYSVLSSVDDNRIGPHDNRRELSCETLNDEFSFQHSKTYAVFVPDRWGKNGEQMIYIKFPDESDQLPFQAYDLPCSGFSTPSTFNLSEEYKSPADSPLVSIPHQVRIYPEPCPLYPLESSFPPVDLPVEFPT